MSAAEPRQQMRGEIFGGRRRRNLELSGAAALELLHGLVGFAQARQEVTRVSPQLYAGGGEVSPPTHSLEQRHPNLEFELLELDGDGGLGEIEFLGGAAEMQMLGGGSKYPQLSESHPVQHHKLSICLSTRLDHLNCSYGSVR
jgi:hypothetical protein